MKKIFLATAITLLAIAAHSNDADILIWDIRLWENGNETVAPGITSAGFDAISKFYLKSTTGDTAFNLSDYTYATSDALVGGGATVSSIFAPGLDDAAYGYAGSYYTNISKLREDIVSATGLSDISEIDDRAWEFYMQLDNNGNRVAWSEHLYDPTADSSSAVYLSSVSGSIYNSSTPFHTINPPTFNFGSHLVPEPTSGLLMMMGAGLLALRRRRRA